ncbi:MAG TPA: hypothetical protein VGA08_02335 [Candidatus Saccharimonadales bacterium]
MNKRRLHHYWRYIRELRTWHIIILLIASSLLSIWALRLNSQELEPFLRRVIAADQNNQGIDKALRDLGNYITNHMNTMVDEPIQLAYSYDRDTQAILDRAEGSANGDIYKKAQVECEDPSVLLSVRALCIQDYVTKHAKPGQSPQAIKFPDKALYTYSFISPMWSPDMAGFLILITAVLALMLMARIIAGWLVKRTLAAHH